ncbi:prepilin-type N-terminal cleavage/methylation domain-containing protein [bacterium]|nr:prepilin-type N-terminal cleavage/methylation domain-containing protein [bacterium]
MYNNNKTLRYQNGFTLVEIIITILIVVIIASIAITKFIDMSETAKTAKCKSNQMAIEAAQRLHYARTAFNGQAEYASTLDDLIPFLRDGTVPVCPSNGDYILKTNGDVTCTEPDHQR